MKNISIRSCVPLSIFRFFALTLFSMTLVSVLVVRAQTSNQIKDHPNAQGRMESQIDLEGATLVLVHIPAGSFQMGSVDCDKFPRNAYCPSHTVTISQDFWIGKYPVTQAQWKAVMEDNPSEFKSAGSNAPVENVSWWDAQHFIKKLNQKAGEDRYRLPTEAEWEYACRAGTQGARYDGSNNSNTIAWHKENSQATTHSVGKKKPNAFGLYDMVGNLWEWCQDWWGPYSNEPVTDPQGASNGHYFMEYGSSKWRDDAMREAKVIRGGGWDSYDGYCMSATRDCMVPYVSQNDLGFRLVKVFP